MILARRLTLRPAALDSDHCLFRWDLRLSVAHLRWVVGQLHCKMLYSLDLNPIEEAFSKIKGLQRVIGARTKEALVEAIGKALDGVGVGDARGFFTHCGYGGPEQHLSMTLY
jgi:hypothetical protein